jgi:hypothetical protein
MDIFMAFIGVASMALMYWQVRIMMAAAPVQVRGTETAAKRLSYWPVIGMGILVVLAWIPYIFHLGQQPLGGIILAWGNVSDGCYDSLDTSKLMEYSGKYYVAMSCGIANPAMDYLQDTTIAMSSPFTITKSPITIEAKFTPQLLDMMKALAALNPPQVGSMWRQAYLLPKNVDISRIKRMSDVREFGGKLIPAGCDPIE